MEGGRSFLVLQRCGLTAQELRHFICRARLHQYKCINAAPGLLGRTIWCIMQHPGLGKLWRLHLSGGYMAWRMIMTHSSKITCLSNGTEKGGFQQLDSLLSSCATSTSATGRATSKPIGSPTCLHRST